MREFIPSNLPITKDIETKEILKKSILANKALAELNGIYKIIPNTDILINSLTLQEAKDSSEIENIITTHDELYKADLEMKNLSHATKEVQNYKSALLKGFDLVQRNKLILKKHIVEIQKELEQNDAGLRRQSGTNLKNHKTGEIIFTPPQNFEDIEKLLKNLEQYINNQNDIDPLINMAIIHFQFETIHPFYDGNGRAGRILNILYLILNELLDIPILYLSNYIITHKNDYYRLLQEVRTKDNWEEWIMYILDSVEQTAKETTQLIQDISTMMIETKNNIKHNLPKIYSKDLIEILFNHPYTKIDFLVNGLGITRQTASKYLKELESLGVLKRLQIKNSVFYINIALFNRLKKGI